MGAAWSPDGERIVLELSGERGLPAAPELTLYIDILDSDGSDRRQFVAVPGQRAVVVPRG